MQHVTENSKDIALISSLLHESKLYTTGNEFKELLDFINNLPHIAPFNAFLLQLQKPGLRFAASATDWKNRFNRSIKEGSRPLIILWPFSPIALVYYLDDTEGEDLPQHVAKSFKATGMIRNYELCEYFRLTSKQGIHVKQIEYGEGHAGHIKIGQHDLTISNQSERYKAKTGISNTLKQMP